MNQPSSLKNMLRAAAGALPLVPRGGQLPSRTVTVDELPIDQANVAEYAGVTGLRYGNNVPLTYPFALTFPTMMSLVTGFNLKASTIGWCEAVPIMIISCVPSSGEMVVSMPTTALAPSCAACCSMRS